jgi:single-strand DNA-binding protein
MYTNNLVLIGNLVDAPEVKVTPAGSARASFRVASTERRRDAAAGTWTDGPSVFVQVTCWRRLAENVANSLSKGDRVIVCGRLRQWVAEKDGVRRTVHEIEADAVGPDLQRGMASIARPRSGSGTAEADNGDALGSIPPQSEGDPVAAFTGEESNDPFAESFPDGGGLVADAAAEQVAV